MEWPLDMWYNIYEFCSIVSSNLFRMTCTTLYYFKPKKIIINTLKNVNSKAFTISIDKRNWFITSSPIIQYESYKYKYGKYHIGKSTFSPFIKKYEQSIIHHNITLNNIVMMYCGKLDKYKTIIIDENEIIFINNQSYRKSYKYDRETMFLYTTPYITIIVDKDQIFLITSRYLKRLFYIN